MARLNFPYISFEVVGIKLIMRVNDKGGVDIKKKKENVHAKKMDRKNKYRIRLTDMYM